ncbi:MAG: peptidoglycan-binding domain-containing protein [Nitrosopumilaceae archaeon]|jgi:hypothetical protein
MKQLTYGQRLFEDLFELNNFDIRTMQARPSVFVIRNCCIGQNGTDFTYAKDTGDNICDSIILYSPVNGEYNIVEGRTIPHRKYQKRMVEGTARANYISPGLYPFALRKGHHRGKEALVQNKAYIIFRSADMIFGNEDDYADPDGFVADNLHGNAPYSAGCITIAGDMIINEKTGEEIRTGDWAETHDWIYNINKSQTFFNTGIFNYSDISSRNRNNWKLMPGSYGERVAMLQSGLRIKPDGDFGPVTFFALRKKQEELGLFSNGIFDIRTRNIWDQMQILDVAKNPTEEI